MPAATCAARHCSIAAFGTAYAVATAFAQNSYYQLIMTVVPVWGVMGLAWNLLSGYSGFVSFGHAAFFGLGAYFVALAQIKWGLTPWLGIPGAGVLGALAGLVVGVPTFRLRGHYFALAMLAYPLALLYVFEWLGYQELTLPMEREAPDRVHAVRGPSHLRLARARADARRDGADQRWSSVRASACRSSRSSRTRRRPRPRASGRWRGSCKAITLSGAMAGTVGGFYAVVLLVVTPPAVFGMLVSAQALIVTMFGGVGTLWGPVIGAVVLVPLSELLHARLGNVIPGIQGVVFGVAIVAVIAAGARRRVLEGQGPVLRRGGAASRPARRAVRRRPGNARGAELPVRAERADTAVMLEVHNVSKAFGGLKAVQDVSMQVFARRDPRHHRAERRGQDHVLQPAQRLHLRRPGARSCSKARTSSASGPTRSAPPASAARFRWSGRSDA